LGKVPRVVIVSDVEAGKYKSLTVVAIEAVHRLSGRRFLKLVMMKVRPQGLEGGVKAGEADILGTITTMESLNRQSPLPTESG